MSLPNNRYTMSFTENTHRFPPFLSGYTHTYFPLSWVRNGISIDQQATPSLKTQNVCLTTRPLGTLKTQYNGHQFSSWSHFIAPLYSPAIHHPSDPWRTYAAHRVLTHRWDSPDITGCHGWTSSCRIAQLLHLFWPKAAPFCPLALASTNSKYILCPHSIHRTTH